MNVILLSGGSGKRLWPLSNEIRSKQFIKIFEAADGSYESMLQKMYKGIKLVNSDTNITIATSKSQKSSIYNQLGNNVDISVEPTRKDTFPAILLAAEYLHNVKKVSLDDSIVVCPIDPYVDEDYFETLEKLYVNSLVTDANISLIGIKPTYPSEKYGYIIPADDKRISYVKGFKEKPAIGDAMEYIAEGALWNAGVFAFKLRYILEVGHKLVDYKDYDDLYNKYDKLEKISFDYAVLEHEQKIDVLRFDGTWKDLGTWNTITEAMQRQTIGDVKLVDSVNTSVVNELKIPVLAMGLKDIVVAASPDGILVSDKNASSYMKQHVEDIIRPIMYSEKSWGEYKVIDVQDESLTILVTLKPGNMMKYHSHENRDETWNVISGVGKIILDGVESKIKAGDVIKLQRGVKHTAIAETELKMIEVQMGKDISREDKKVYQLNRM